MTIKLICFFWIRLIDCIFDYTLFNIYTTVLGVDFDDAEANVQFGSINTSEALQLLPPANGGE
jgi:hypothetical protein